MKGLNSIGVIWIKPQLTLVEIIFSQIKKNSFLTELFWIQVKPSYLSFRTIIYINFFLPLQKNMFKVRNTSTRSTSSCFPEWVQNKRQLKTSKHQSDVNWHNFNYGISSFSGHDIEFNDSFPKLMKKAPILNSIVIPTRPRK